MNNGYFWTVWYHTLCVFVRIASARRFLQISEMYVFLKSIMGISMKKYTIRWFLCRPNWRYITNFAITTNVVIKRVHCISLLQRHVNFSLKYFSNDVHGLHWRRRYKIVNITVCPHVREIIEDQVVVYLPYRRTTQSVTVTYYTSYWQSSFCLSRVTIYIFSNLLESL